MQPSTLVWLCVALGVASLAPHAAGDVCQCPAPGAPLHPHVAGAGPIDGAKFPLHNATAEWNLTRMAQAIKNGADINQREASTGLTPLQVALLTTGDPYWHPYYEPVYQAIKLLLDSGANPNITPPQSYSDRESPPLFWVANDGRMILTYWMLKAGADVNYVTRDGWTAIRIAAGCDFRLSYDPRAAATIKVLLAFLANMSAGYTDCRTAFQDTPGYPDCEAKYPDESDCPKTCKVLRDGISEQETAAIRAGKLPDDESSEFRRCCSDPLINSTHDNEASQCCL